MAASVDGNDGGRSVLDTPSSIPPNVLFLGDNHIVRFENFMWSYNQSWPSRPLQFDVNAGKAKGWIVTKPHFMGMTDATVSSLGSADTLQEIAYLHPDIVILHMTGNEIDTLSGPTPQYIGMQMYLLAKKLLDVGVKQVVICQMVMQASWCQLSPEEGEVCVSGINEFLQAACEGGTEVHTWRHRRLGKTKKPVLEADGIHYNDWGNYKLYRSFRGAVMTTFHHVCKMG